MMARPTASAIATAPRAREKNVRAPARQHTKPKHAATIRLQPRESASNWGDDAVDGRESVHPASSTQTIASPARPPFHHATSAHAASAGMSRMMLCSIGVTTRSGVMGSSVMARRARMGPRHPSSRGAAAPSTAMLGLVAPDVRDDREEARALHGRRQLPLVARADATQPARQDLAVVG